MALYRKNDFLPILALSVVFSALPVCQAADPTPLPPKRRYNTQMNLHTVPVAVQAVEKPEEQESLMSALNPEGTGSDDAVLQERIQTESMPQKQPDGTQRPDNKEKDRNRNWIVPAGSKPGAVEQKEESHSWGWLADETRKVEEDQRVKMEAEQIRQQEQRRREQELADKIAKEKMERPSSQTEGFRPVLEQDASDASRRAGAWADGRATVAEDTRGGASPAQAGDSQPGSDGSSGSDPYADIERTKGTGFTTTWGSDSAWSSREIEGDSAPTRADAYLRELTKPVWDSLSSESYLKETMDRNAEAMSAASQGGDLGGRDAFQINVDTLNGVREASPGFGTEVDFGTAASRQSSGGFTLPGATLASPSAGSGISLPSASLSMPTMPSSFSEPATAAGSLAPAFGVDPLNRPPGGVQMLLP